MLRAFLDANVLFAAAYSATGASRELLRCAARGEAALVVSDVVIEEARRNLAEKAPAVAPLIDALLKVVPHETAAASAADVRAAEEYTEPKDAPIIAAAIKAQARYLVTLDRVHLLDAEGVAARSGLEIVLPGTFLHLVRRQHRAP